MVSCLNEYTFYVLQMVGLLMKKVQLKFFSLITIVLLLAGCAMPTTQKYDTMLNQWLNKSELQLVSYWGAPNKTYKLGNQQFLSYYTQYNEDIPDVTQNYQPFFINGLPDYDPVLENVNYQVVPEVCKTTFTIENGVVVAWNHHGAGCIAN